MELVFDAEGIYREAMDEKERGAFENLFASNYACIRTYPFRVLDVYEPGIDSSGPGQYKEQAVERAERFLERLSDESLHVEKIYSEDPHQMYEINTKGFDTPEEFF